MLALNRALVKSPLVGKHVFQCTIVSSQKFNFHSSVIRYNESNPIKTEEKKPKLASQEVPPKIYDFAQINKLVSEPDATKVLVDVREPSELQQEGYIPTAVNIPFKSAPGALNLPEDEFEDVFHFDKPTTDKELIFYCHKGIRSTAAQELANTFGYQKRGNYVGSFADWVENGGKIVKKE